MRKNSGDWALPYGGKANSLFHRPLIPMALCFAGGIFAGREIPLHTPWFILGLFTAAAASLILLLFLSASKKAWPLLLIFFLVGALWAQEDPSASRLTQLAQQHKKALIEGTVLEPVKRIGRIGRLTLLAQSLHLPSGAIPLDEHIVVTIYKHLPELQPGDAIRFTARLRTFRNFGNPGNYNYERAMKLKRLTCAASVSDGSRIVIAGSDKLPFFRSLIEHMQQPVRDLFNERLGPRNNALFRALILGERQGITPALREPFNQTGLGHLLAVSGLHIGLVAGAAFFLFKWLLSRNYRLALALDIRKLSALLTAFPVVAYTLLAGFQVSSQRAMIMILAFLGSLILGREREVWSTLSLAGLLVLLVDPNALFSVSFQLSFMAVIGILWLAPFLLNLLQAPPPLPPEERRKPSRILQYFKGLAVVSASAVFFLLPVTSFYFHRISLVSIPANLTTVPILGMWIIPIGLLSALTVPISSVVAGHFLQISAWGLDIMMTVIQFWANLPKASVWIVTPTGFEIILFYALLFFVFFFKRFKWAKIGLAAAVVCMLADAAYWLYRVQFNPHLQVTFLDVGKGNAAFIAFPGGKKMLIDGGGFSSSSFDVGQMVVAPFLWHAKIHQIDYLVLTHPQADHMNGLRFIARCFGPNEFWYNGDQVETPTYRELMDIVKHEGIQKMLPADLADGIEINGVRVQVLHPPPSQTSRSFIADSNDLNNHSLVLRITYGDTSILFPGDLEKTGEEALIARAGGKIQSDILLTPHHGSRTSSSQAFLDRVQPKVCIVSSGERVPRYFPHPVVVERLRHMGCRILKTSKDGAVTVTVRPGETDIQTFAGSEQTSKNTFP